MNNRIAVSFTIVDFMNGNMGVDGKPRPYRVTFNKKTEDGYYIETTWDLLPSEVKILELCD